MIKTQGSGITERAVMQFDSAIDLKEIIAAAKHSMIVERFSTLRKAIAETATAILESCNLPRDPRGTYAFLAHIKGGKARTAFIDHAGVTLQHVRDKVAALPASTKRRDTISALDAVHKLFKKDLAAIPANWLALRTLFESRNGAQLGISPKRYANILIYASVRMQKPTARPGRSRSRKAMFWMVGVPQHTGNPIPNGEISNTTAGG